MEAKKDIRKRVFALRKEMTEEDVTAKSLRIAQQLLQIKAFQDADRIYAYADCKHEASTIPIIEAAWRLGKEVAVPKVEGKDMIFYKLESFNQLQPGYYQIPEPTCGEIVQWEDALMLMPGVAFDRDRHRVGYGGGFYDRFLAAHHLDTIALAFEFQMFDQVPWEDFDLLPDMVLTEEHCYGRQ